MSVQRATGSPRMASGISGSRAVISRSNEARTDRQRSRRERNDDRGIPGIAHTAEIERQHESDARRHDQAGAQHVEPMRALVTWQASQQPAGERERDQSHRQVDQEDHLPMQIFRNKAAERGPHAPAVV